MHIPIPNAFTINRLGLESAPFPFGFSRRDHGEGLVSLYIVPVQLVDLADLLAGYAQATVVLYDVSHNDFDDAGNCRPFGDIAQTQGVPGTLYDDSTIRIATSDLGQFLDDLPHYQLHVFDLKRDADEDALVSAYVAASGHDWAHAGPTLPHLPGSRLFLDIHDDCYLYLETTKAALAQAILGRMLQIYVGTLVWEEAGQQTDVPDLPSDMLSGFWRRFPQLTTFRDDAGYDGQQVRIAFSATELSFREERTYPVAGHIVYDLESRQWELWA